MQHSRNRKRPILWFYRTFLSKRCVFHSTSEFETGYIRQQLSEDVLIVEIPNFLEIPDQVPRDRQNYLLYLGRLKPKKGIQNLIEALARSTAFLQSDFVLKVAGPAEDNYIETLRRLTDDLDLNNKIQFTGPVEGAAKEKLYADAYWTFMPSHTENFGMVVLESLAQNTPVFASTGTPWKILENEKVGFWADNSPVSLAQTIDKIIEMPADEYEGYRRRGRAFVEEHFDIRKNIDRWNDFYASLADK